MMGGPEQMESMSSSDTNKGEGTKLILSLDTERDISRRFGLFRERSDYWSHLSDSRRER